MSTQPANACTLGLVQMRCSDSKAENVARALGFVEEAASRGANLISLPELFASRYFCQVEDPALFDLAEPIPGPTTDAIAQLARRLGVVVVTSVFEKRTAGLFHNSAAVIDADGSLTGIYRKMHIPDDPGYYEKYYFTPGDLGFRAWKTAIAEIGVCICWDQWFPEAARLTALRGAEILFYPTAIGWHPSEKDEWGERQIESWEIVQRSHAIANGCFVAAANRVGHEPAPDGAGDGIEFWGRSFVAGPQGEMLARAGDDEEVLIVEIDLDQIDRQRVHWPFLRDRRIDAYDGLSQRLLD